MINLYRLYWLTVNQIFVLETKSFGPNISPIYTKKKQNLNPGPGFNIFVANCVVNVIFRRFIDNQNVWKKSLLWKEFVFEGRFPIMLSNMKILQCVFKWLQIGKIIILVITENSKFLIDVNWNKKGFSLTTIYYFAELPERTQNHRIF